MLTRLSGVGTLTVSWPGPPGVTAEPSGATGASGDPCTGPLPCASVP